MTETTTVRITLTRPTAVCFITPHHLFFSSAQNVKIDFYLSTTVLKYIQIAVFYQNIVYFGKPLLYSKTIGYLRNPGSLIALSEVSHYGIRPFRVFLRSPITLCQPQLAGRHDVVSGSGFPTPQYKGSDTTSLRHSKLLHLFLA